MAARVAANRRFLADSRQELHEVHRSQTPDRSRQNLPLLGHRVGRHRAAGNAWKVRLLKSLSRRWAKSAIANQSRLQHANPGTSQERYFFAISAPATKLSLPILHIW